MSTDLAHIDLTDNRARADRDRLASRTDVLDKVGVLRTLPDDMHVTTDMVAAFYQVDAPTVRQVVNRNREELDADGYDVISRGEVSDKLSLTPDELGMPRNAGSLALFPRRAVLRIGMLLRDSPVARKVRDYLLDAERFGNFVIPRTLPEALRAYAAEVEAHELTKARNAELEPKAALADDYLTAQGGARLVRQVAKTFGLTESELRRFLVDDGLIYVRHAPCGDVQYDHYAQFAHHFLPRETIVQHQWGSCSHYTLMVLPRGVELIGKRLRAKGMLP
ncbi:phage antirepressor KilAC domain-containing protein [Mycobacterium avium subsp. hominissuis]|uniref:phage antirepressor KilAC domain-containing protein n=1 Tax=Mycobacterium avium TaxID=1764 RepID=UPI00031909BE|nr:phage antirepressor KilAC domain-containing protein [Mycobacterium avium]MBZ4500145.1 hypothetical protein [Mycobacterium avium subsp. hominissuis]MBZ4547792.1 hypothetical protein [Mycobacterium avium subsp. hominissuis]MBZ4600325.1 hypothetical protein [Mycobacterium avium subsp. hominissuis]MDO2381930.1 phage antirepressor KilAC domain-containing protein [Mycobacterium avium subsp. hominissuis]